jgi:hypothetical protein
VEDDMTDPVKLIHLYLDDRLTPEQASEFRSRILEDDDFSRLFARYGLLNSYIRNEFVEEDLQESLDRFAMAAPSEACSSVDCSDTGQVSTESIMKSGDPNTEKVHKIKAQAERQLHTFLAEQEELNRVPSSPRRAPISLYEACRRWATKLDLLLKQVITIGVRIALCAGFILVIWGGIYYWLTHRVVATLGETVQARWAQSPQGNDLRPGWMTLEQGYARIVFKNGAETILQAPCRFRLCSPEKMILFQGTLSAIVPKRAIGFSIDTPTAEIVDYGTEFGVLVDAANQSEIHVFKGEVGVCSSTANRKTPECRLKGGQNALSSLSNGVQIGKATRGLTHFVRDMGTAMRAGLPGKWLDLADMVGGGSGLGTGRLVEDRGLAGGTINPFTGILHDGTRPEGIATGEGDGTASDSGLPHPFRPVASLPFVDGIFIPDQDGDGCVVSSRGHAFAQCPDTDGNAIMNLANGWNLQSRKNTPRAWSEARGISMHANLGITFDLQAMRDTFSGVRIVRFTAQAGIPVSARSDVSDADVWVLVDGRLRFTHRAVRSAQMFDIDIPLAAHERFLTLITTDGGRVRGDARKASAWDWCFFADPTLELEVEHER